MTDSFIATLVEDDDDNGILAAKIAAATPYAHLKLRRAHEDQQAARGRIHVRYEQIQKIQSRNAEFQAWINTADREKAAGVKYSEKDDERVEGWRAQLAAGKAEILRIQNDKNPFATGVGLERLVDFFRGLPIKRITESLNDKTRPGANRIKTIVPPTFRDARATLTAAQKKDPRAAFTTESTNLAALVAERKSTHGAPLTLAEAEAAVVADIEAMAKQGQPNFSGVFRLVRTSMFHPPTQQRVKWPMHQVTSQRGAREAESGVSFSAWLFKDQLIARAKEELQRLHDPARAISQAARRVRIVELDKQILAQERLVESLIDEIVSIGGTVKRTVQPPDCRAYLGIEVIEDFETLAKDSWPVASAGG